MNRYGSRLKAGTALLFLLLFSDMPCLRFQMNYFAAQFYHVSLSGAALCKTCTCHFSL